MKSLQPLPVSALYSHCDSEQFDFTTTETLEDIAVTTGQERARDSIHFGIAVNRDGFNVFALGSPGTGKFTAVREMITERARNEPVPPDWCYVNNFERPHQPIVLRLPGGDGARLHADMAQLVEELGTVLPAAFDNEDTNARMEEIEEEFREHRTNALNELRQEAQNLSIAVLETPVGFTFSPIGPDNEALRPDQYEKLAREEQKRIQKNVSLLQTKLQKLLAQFQAWRKDTRGKTKALYREIAEFAVGHLIDELRKQYAELSEVLEYLDAVQEDIVGHVSDFLPQPESPLALGAGAQRTPPVQRYSVNLLVDNSRQEGAPVVYEDLPNHANLIGRVEHQAHMGTLLTDFTLIKSGALHRANGGYLILDARRVLLQPFAWESLKRVLRSGEIRIESLERSLSLISTVAVEPEPIPLDLKVVLVGDRLLYYLLYEYDPEFRELFKVGADFEDTMDRSVESEGFYARLIATLARREKLRPLNPQAVARTIEHCARLTGDSQKLSTHLRGLDDLLSEADHWAGEAKHDFIDRQDIECAIDKRIQRSDRVRDRIYEAIQRGTIIIATEGTAIGQVNALSVLRLGDFEFGQPSRVTATARLGEGEVVDIQREVELGGPIHSKGVLILSGFLMSRYAKSHPVSLTASLVFEQSYGMVDGDSASLAELCALLSTLSGAPIRQSLAMTGSVNQHGQVQAIGGVNEKIEGFFDVCKARGLDGTNGVIIPAANVKDLMLRGDVVAAAGERKFCVYAVTSVDEAIELLTGVAAGEPDETGAFPADSINGRVHGRLVELANIRRSFSEKSRNTDGNEEGRSEAAG